MPFAGYKDFASCVRQNSDKTDPKAYCGSIKAKVEKAQMRELLRKCSPAGRHILLGLQQLKTT